MKILAEKQEATELFIEEQQEGAISEAEARLAELEERSKILRERQGEIAAVHNLSDTELIKVCTPALIIPLGSVERLHCLCAFFYCTGKGWLKLQNFKNLNYAKKKKVRLLQVVFALFPVREKRRRSC